MTAPAVHPSVFRITGSRAPFCGRGKRSKFLWACTGPDHASWLITTPRGETLGPFADLREDEVAETNQ